MAFPEPFTPEQLNTYFPSGAPEVAEGVFELGLVLGGTVSAGAYTGGVLDYLIEALDAWQCARNAEDPKARPHQVVITTIGGSSGGAISGAILARAANREFDHGANSTNPFFEAWTQGVDLMKLLSPTGDTDGFGSLFNTKAIEDQVTKSIKWNGGRVLGSQTSPEKREYLADPLRLFMMVGNVSGIPYRLPMAGDSGLDHDLVAHADYLRFALSVPGGSSRARTLRPDEVPLNPDSNTNWNVVGDASLATSAFPLAFRGRNLDRALELTAFRAVAVPSDAGPAIVQQLIPKWEAILPLPSNPGVVRFANVDAGTFNNEPLDIVRQAMAGMAGHNPRGPSKAKRAVILIDPFSDPVTLSNPDTSKLTEMIGPLINSMIQQPRFKPVDLALAYNEDVYSRFLVAPTRRGSQQPIVGKMAIASGGLAGFLGFIDARLLVHDYKLGRANAHSFLRKHLMLPEEANNPLFNVPWWTEERKAKYGHVEKGKRYLPIIPLVDSLRDHPPPADAWPTNIGLPSGFAAAVEARLELIYSKLRAQYVTGGWLQKAVANAYLWAGWRFYLRRALRDAAVSTFTKSLEDQGLRPRTS